MLPGLLIRFFYEQFLSEYVSIVFSVHKTTGENISI